MTEKSINVLLALTGDLLNKLYEKGYLEFPGIENPIRAVLTGNGSYLLVIGMDSHRKYLNSHYIYNSQKNLNDLADRIKRDGMAFELFDKAGSHWKLEYVEPSINYILNEAE